MCFTLGIFTNSVTQVLIQWLPSSLVDAHVCYVSQTQMTVGLAPYNSHKKGSYESYVINWIWEYKYHSMFSCLQKTLLASGCRERSSDAVLKVFVWLFITGQIFLWIPSLYASWSEMKDPAGMVAEAPITLWVSSFAARVCLVELGLGMGI